jgi:chromosome segregation ATPase
MEINDMNTLLISIKNLNEKIDNLIIKVNNIENKINGLSDNIETHNDIIDERTSKLDYHVDFTVQVYNTVKKPMDFFTNTLNKYIGVSPIKLPELNYITHNEPTD